MSSNQHITSAELRLFLDDVDRNIESDEGPHFRRLILYLFSFTNDKLFQLSQSELRDQDEEKLLQRLISTIELVLTKKLHLLNLELNHNDYKLIHIPASDGDNLSKFLANEPSHLLYDWAISFALHHIAKYHNKISILNYLKSFVIQIISLVATKLHSFKYTKQIRTSLMSLMETNLQFLIHNLSSLPNTEIYQSKLIITVHLFSLLNDYDVANRLLLNLSSYQLTFDSYARKIWFVLSEVNSQSKQDSQLVGNLKSITILNLTDNLVLNDCITWNQISLVLEWVIGYIRSELSKGDSTTKFNNFNLNKTISYSLLKVLRLCIEKDIAHNFMYCLNFNKLIIKITTSIEDLHVPALIVKSFHILNYYCNLAINNTSIVASYQTSANNRHIITPFNDKELESLRVQLVDRTSQDTHSIVSQLLSYLENDEMNEAQEAEFSNRYVSPNFNYLEWIQKVRAITVKSGSTDAFSELYSQYMLITALGHFPCLVSNDFNFKVKECTKCGSGPMNKNYYDVIDLNRKPIPDSTEISIYYKEILCKYYLGTKAQFLHDNPLLCCNFLLSVYKLFASYGTPRGLISKEPVFKFTMQLLATNTNRDVRILATRILPLYLLQPKDKVTVQNFKIIFQGISAIEFSPKSKRYLGESTIKAFVELAIVSEGEWLCVLFIKLIDLLGEKNEQHANYVYNGFITIASAKSLAPWRLLYPFLPSIAEIIIKKPRLFSKMTDLLGIARKYFLNRTREYTTPRLLEYYKVDFIQEIADSCSMSKLDLVYKNLPRIIALYLVKDATINERYIMSVLRNISPTFKSVELSNLITNIGETTWYILLQIQVDDSNEKITNEGRIVDALTYVAKVSLDQKRKELPRQMDYVEYLLGDNVLELVQMFSENVHHIKGSKPYLEKVSSLRSIEYIINKNIQVVTAALGQISSCLQATLEIPDFQYYALRCWNVLVHKLPPSHLISLIDIIISLIFQKFQNLDGSSKDLSIEILKRIYEEIKDKYNSYTLYYLSIPFLDHIQEYKPISGFRNVKQMSRITIFSEFTRRIQTNNEYVVQQALYDLLNYCEKYQANCQLEYFREPTLEPYITELVRTILDTSSLFKNKNDHISTSCAKVLSVIGSLDSNKFNFKSVKHQIIVIQDFKDYRENSEFLIDFIETKVLKIFWASNDPMKQLFSAYAMQNFLQVLRLDPKVLTPSSQDHLLAVWNKFSDVAQSTLTPLLASKYYTPPSKYSPLSFPYFKISMKYETWLMEITSDLLKRPSKNIDGDANEAKQTIFQTCSKLIRDQDLSLCQHLLKYVSLSHIVNGNKGATTNIKEEFLNILHFDATSSSPDRIEQLKSCLQSVLEVLDYFNEWVSTATQYLNNYSLDNSEASRIKKNIRYVNDFLGFIPMDLIAIKSAECDSYERTILYLERCYREGKVDDSFMLANLNIGTTLQSMYSSINDYDALNGVLKKFSTSNLSEKLTTFQYNESWSLAQESFQVLGSVGDEESRIGSNTKLLMSLNDNGLYEEVLSTLSAKTSISDISSIPLDWSLVGLQSSIYSGDMYQMKKWLHIVNSLGKPHDVETLVNYELAKGIVFLSEGNRSDFEKAIQNLYGIIGTSLVPSISSSFSRNTNLMNQLHSIYDLTMISQSNNELLTGENEKILEARLGNVDQGFDAQWKILKLHGVTNKIVKREWKISEILLKYSALARKSNRLDISTRSIVQAMALNDERANIEYAKLLWAQGKQTEAIKSLADILEENRFDNQERKADVQLKYAQWLDESNHLSSSAIIKEYNKSVELNPSWEKPYYDLGKYYNKIMESTNDQTGYYEHQTVRHFLKALAVGHSFIFEALPKSITIWLDFAQRKTRSREAERKLNQIVEDIKTCLNTIPLYVWYTAITQLLSRIVHEHQPSFEKLSLIIFNIIREYPRHSLWYVLSHANSNDPTRRERINSVLRKVTNENREYGSIVVNAKELFSSLIKIASFKIPKSPRAKRLSLRQDFKVDNLNNPYTSLVIPVRSNLEIRLPATNTVKFNAFPKSSSITFDGFDDYVNIFFSLQMPRQVTIRGSDNKPYRLMVKRDDTRKDAKVVEFTTMINRLLLSSNEARKRGLQISNYSVIPLAENMGVIEFVTDVQTMKGIAGEQRKRMGRSLNERKIFMKLDDLQKQVKGAKASDPEPLNKLVDVFKKILEDNPPVLHSWFIDQFSDPTAWYLARNQFTRSSAVMSMVGYIIGLGDRHCENILFFKKTGSVLHIDFDCLFDKGETLPTPEIVPFRLTSNMIDAMGICGIEGSFRITCEVTGSLLRENEAPLMNILETLLYDPLLDWKSVQKPEAHLSKVRRKIRGLVNEKEGLPMNIHGQVDVLIQEASSIERLSQMYGGWSAYI
ncbi:hypothetical protein G9P44_002713 [Scheffersomyces stipitis]|nr:hypothetical protein G9P44_002713 [Scheffersomyces stipitis]